MVMITRRAAFALVVLWTTATALAQPAPPIIPPRTMPADAKAEQIYPLGTTTANRGAQITLINAQITPRYGDLVAPGDGRFLVLATEWENIIPWTIVDEQKIGTTYRITNLSDHLYVVVNGSIVCRVFPKENDVPGHVPVKPFELAHIGSRQSGNVLFTVPPVPITSLELRFYDFAHGHMAAPIMLPAAGALPQPNPLAPPQKNEVVEAAVFGVEKKPEMNGAKAPEGMTYVVADLRARSMFTYPADATAFDPKAKPGAIMQIGTVADWNEADRYLQLVVDGERAYGALKPASTLPDAPRFLPDVMTGGRVVFLAPADAKSLELRCDFPNAKQPDGKVIRPKGLTLAIEGKRPALEQLKSIASVDDDVYKVAVTSHSAADTYAGAKAPQGKKFLVLSVAVHNVGQNGELFQTKEQLKCATGDGAQLEVDPATYQGKYRPSELVFIPPGERRAFDVVYAIPANENKPRLAYGGVSLAKMLDLPPLDGAAVAAAPADAPAAAPADAPAVPVTPAPAPAEPVKPAPQKPQVAAATPTKVEPKVEPKVEAKKPAAKSIDKLDVTRIPAKHPHEPKGLAGVGLTPEQVNKSIERGAEFLWNYIKANDLKSGYQYGYRQEHMLAALALVHAEAHKKFPDFDAVVRKYMATFDPLYSSATYQNGLYCMLIQSYGDPTYLPQLRKTAQWLVDTQGPEGTWGYGVHVKGAQVAEARIRRVLHVAGGRPLDEPAGGEPLVRKTPWDKGADGDNSVTQYALLGLHAASRFDVKLPRETWERTLKEHRERQDKTLGGYGYTSPGAGHNYGSMTCAGVCALALARHELGEKEPAVDADVEEGLAWLRQYFTVKGNPHPVWNTPDALGGEWHYYYLYSLERVGRILDTEFIGEHEWYPQGAKQLLGAQRSADGGWLSKEDRNDPVLSTSFALLFLTRATQSLDLPKRSGPGTLKTAVAMPPSMRIHVILDCSGSMLEEMEGRPKFDIAREAVMSLVDALPEAAQFGLRVYGHRKRATEEGASDDTELLVPIGGVKREVLQAKLRELRARGKTPMAKSLIDAKGDVRGGTAENPIVVILLTDGGEDSQPRRDPLKAAEEFGTIEGVRLHVVGFDISRPDWLEQLQGMAARAHGQFLPAQQSAALQRELKSAVFGTPEGFAIVDAAGKPAGAGAFGESKALPEGKYTFRTAFAGKQFEQGFWINAGATTAVTFDAAMVAKEEGAARAAAPAPAPAPAEAAAPTATPPAPAPPAAAGNKFCTSCGTKLAPAAKFCTACGAKQ